MGAADAGMMFVVFLGRLSSPWRHQMRMWVARFDRIAPQTFGVMPRTGSQRVEQHDRRDDEAASGASCAPARTGASSLFEILHDVDSVLRRFDARQVPLAQAAQPSRTCAATSRLPARRAPAMLRDTGPNSSSASGPLTWIRGCQRSKSSTIG